MSPVIAPILSGVTTQLGNPLADASLSEAERRTVRRSVAMLGDALGENLRAVWLYGSRARGERGGRDSDVDLLVIAAGDTRRNQRLALELSEEAALAEGESPFTYSVHVYDPGWLRGRREINSFFIQEVDRDKLVLAGSALDEGRVE
jgi:predicted nucleotidyltransferase